MKKMANFIRRVILFLIRGAIQELAVDLELYEKINAAKSSSVYLAEKMVDAKRFTSAKEVLSYAIESTKLDGAILEFGVFSGGTIQFISEKFPPKKIYGFDSFEGLPENWRPGFPRKAFDLHGALPKVPDNVILLKGWFNQTLPKWKKENQSMVSFLHVDCDLYSSTKTIFHELSDRIVEDTIIVFDEYFNFPGWETSEYKAFQEWIESSSLDYRYLAVNVRHEQVAVKIYRKFMP